MLSAQLSSEFKPLGLETLTLRLHTEKDFPKNEEGYTDVDHLIGIERGEACDVIVFYIILNGETFRGFIPFTDKETIEKLKNEEHIYVVMQKNLTFSRNGFRMTTKQFLSNIFNDVPDIRKSDNLKENSKVILEYIFATDEMTTDEELQYAQAHLLPQT